MSTYLGFHLVTALSESLLNCGGYMKVLVWNKEKCIACGTCEKVCSQTWFKEENREKSRIRITKTDDGIIGNACIQCGECIDVCPVEALTRDAKGVVRLNEKICIGCQSCVGFCPTLSMFTAKTVEKPFKCIACGICVKSCPTGALSIEERPEPMERVFYRRHF